MLRSGAIEAPPATMQSAAMRWGHLPLAEESGTIAPQLVLTAHGSKDPRSAANARAIAGRLARMRPGLDVRVAFCELNSPNLVDVLNRCRGAAVVTPLLLADAYHARVDIPAQIASCRVGHRVRQASVLGEDIRLVSALHERLTELGVSPFDHTLGVVVLAIGSSHPAANARTSTVASRLAEGTQWAAVTTAFITDRRLRWPMPPIGCDATVPVGWSSRHGCSPLGYCLTGYADTHGKPASRWHNRWVHTRWWPRPCGIATDKPWPVGSRPRSSRRSAGTDVLW